MPTTRHILVFFDFSFSFSSYHIVLDNLTLARLVSCERIRFIRLVLKWSDSYVSIAWYHIIHTLNAIINVLSHFQVTFIKLGTFMFGIHVHLVSWYILRFAYVHVQHTCTPGYHMFLSYSFYIVSVLLRVRLCVCAFHWSGSSLFLQDKRRVQVPFRFVKQLHFLVRIVCSSLMGRYGPKAHS